MLKDGDDFEVAVVTYDGASPRPGTMYKSAAFAATLLHVESLDIYILTQLELSYWTVQ